MSSDCPVVGVVDGTVPDVRALHGSTQVKVDGIATKSESLSSVSYLSVFNPKGENGR